MKQLILGGARSGKSRLAEEQAAHWAAQAPGREVVVVVTARSGPGDPNAPRDPEMAERIAQHRARRPADWQTVEAPVALATALRAADGPQRLLLVDCLTLWLTNLLLADLAPEVDLDTVRHLPLGDTFTRERTALLDTLPTLQAPVLLIGNEVGHGIVPLGALNRQFVDESGRLHQALAAQCERVDFVMAGCVLALKTAATGAPC
ncbi:bifunctional adenosylcobinamide kinase/adenosylcobinamide-phosphate guanylyltransferase [Ideonella livida]|uniref:Bifunctional adenosylcobalamin biosynthesis protein n=1 Tax=Ideonella livida TaxID=2707176 RepID=A0A7C9TIU8_9BURK|nr:bifunctional adenosylcobinamide kinase/adenosylcobinamide-phosphate guanylyltransferase [Ideonella livida]NDY91318.1 bifunctional adenosylcobinamide kinase/adenosylcobinamide-phosphate guanylyltransferase [Ideonella livida]